MKRLVMMLMAVSLILPVAVAQNKQLQKALKKEYTKKLKELQKGGYEMFGSARTLDVALLKHYEQLEQGGGSVMEVPGFATAKSYNLAALSALTSAANHYATQAKEQVQARVLSDMSGDVSNHEAEFDKFYAAYEGKVEMELKGQLRNSFSVMRRNDDGTITVQAFYLVNEDSANRARINAFKEAAAETNISQQYAGKISEFVNDRVEAGQ